ncbi:MAG: porin [Burkholderiales bacterium]
MKKKLIAVAVAGALVTPAAALAQTTIYGRFNVEWGVSISQMDPAAASASGQTSRETVDGFNSGASYVGVRGEEKLGGGMSVWYQCETRARFGADTNPTQGTSGICDRNSALGLKGGFGNFFIGRWDTAIETQSGNTRFVGSTGFQGAQHILTEGQDTTIISFAQRVQNSYNYESPNWGGFSFGASSTSRGAAVNTTPNGNQDGRINSVYGKYEGGPLLVWGGYEKHDDNQAVASGGRQGSSENMTALGASYVLGPVKFGFTYTDFDGDGTVAGTDIKRSSFLLGVDWKITPAGTIRVAYMEADDYKGSDARAALADQGAKQYSLHYIHALSKRTFAAAYYAKVDNDTNGKYNYHGFSTDVKPGESAGAFVLQLQHNF